MFSCQKSDRHLLKLAFMAPWDLEKTKTKPALKTPILGSPGLEFQKQMGSVANQNLL